MPDLSREQLREIVQLVEAHSAARRRLSTAVAAYAAAQARAQLAWYDPVLVREMSARIARQVVAGQRQLAAITDAYLARLLAALAEVRVAPAGTVPVEGLRRGVDLLDVYDRLGGQYRWLRSQGLPEPEAIARVVARAEVMADTDLSLAFQRQIVASLDEDVAGREDVYGYRRVVRPELAAGGTCGLCIIASDRIYTRGNLLPLHGRCGCTVAPITEAGDPGEQLNRQDLDALYEAAGSNRAKDLKRTRYVVQENSELGPVLAAEGDAFRSEPASTPRTTAPDPDPEPVRDPEPAPEPEPEPTPVERVFGELSDDDARRSIRPDLTEEQRAAIDGYTGTDYLDYNAWLRGGRNPEGYDEFYSPEEIDRMVNTLESTMVPLPVDIKVFRYMDTRGLNVADQSPYSLVGATIKDKGFLSTGTRDLASIQAVNGGKIRMEIDVPAGTRGVYVEEFSSVKGEFELILAPDTPLRVKAVRPDGDYTTLLMEVAV